MRNRFAVVLHCYDSIAKVYRGISILSAPFVTLSQPVAKPSKSGKYDTEKVRYEETPTPVLQLSTFTASWHIVREFLWVNTYNSEITYMSLWPEIVATDGSMGSCSLLSGFIPVHILRVICIN